MLLDILLVFSMDKGNDDDLQIHVADNATCSNTEYDTLSDGYSHFGDDSNNDEYFLFKAHSLIEEQWNRDEPTGNRTKVSDFRRITSNKKMRCKTQGFLWRPCTIKELRLYGCDCKHCKMLVLPRRCKRCYTQYAIDDMQVLMSNEKGCLYDYVGPVDLDTCDLCSGRITLSLSDDSSSECCNSNCYG